MMLVPRKNSFDLFDDFFDDEFFPRNSYFQHRERSLMKTDIREKKDKYLLDIDLPGFSKDNIHITLENGYLNIHAKIDSKNKKDDDEKIVRQERFYGECQRNFYVGENIKEEDIQAEFTNGILRVEIPKKENTTKKEETKHIPIK